MSQEKVGTLKSWLEEVEDELYELQVIISSYQKEAGLKEEHVEDLKEQIKIVKKDILETRKNDE